MVRKQKDITTELLRKNGDKGGNRLFEDNFINMLQRYPDAVKDKKVFIGLLKDYFPEQQMQVNLISNLFAMGIAEDIQNTASISNAFAFRFVKAMVDNYGVNRINADWAVSVWCVGYGAKILGKNCEITLKKQGSGPAIKEEQSSSGKQYGDLFTYTRSMQGNGLGVTGFNGAKKDTVIFQNRANNVPVIEICDSVFSGQQIEEAILTEGISFIGKKAFSECEKLHQVVLPISMKEIGDHAFENCTSLKSISLPMQLEKLGAASLKRTGLRSIIFPKSLYWIGEEALSNCEELTDIVIPENIDRIPDKMLESCIKLKKVSLHEKLSAIGNRAFWGCNMLDFIVIPDSVQSIGEDAFTGTDKQFIVQCSFGSYAEQYCRKNKIKYQLV